MVALVSEKCKVFLLLRERKGLGFEDEGLENAGFRSSD